MTPVLATLDRVEATYDCLKYPRTHANLREARDVVAELIEAAKGVSVESMRERDGNDTLYLRIAELEIALARVQP